MFAICSFLNRTGARVKGETLGTHHVVSIDRRTRYETSMTDVLEQAVQTVRGLPPETQDALERILLQLAGDDRSTVRLSAAFQTSFAQAERGEFATDDEVSAIWAKHGL
jgi:hypothetical protein